MSEHWCACGEDINGHEWQAAAKRHLDLATEYRLRAEQAEATIWAVQEACKAKQGPRFHNDPYNRGWDNALAWVERIVDGER